jgi:hypothetical protein
VGKSSKFTKLLSQQDLHKSEFSWAYLYAKIWSSKTSVKMNWFENKKWVGIWNSNHTTLIVQTKPVQDFIQASIVHSETLYNTIAATVIPWVSQPSPITEISTRDSKGVAALQEQRTIAHFLTMAKWSLDGENKGNPHFPTLLLPHFCCSIVSWRLDHFTPCDTILVIQDFDWVLEVL